MDRKKLLSIATLAVVPLSACSVGTGDASDGDGGESLTYVSWGGGYQEAQEAHMVQPWAEQNDFTIRSDGPTDYAKIKAQVESGNPTWDVVSLEPFWAIANCGTLLEPIADQVDTSNLPEEATSECTVPVDIISYLMVYDTEKFGDNPPTSWDDFFDTETYPGKRAIWNFANSGAMEAALLADGVAPEDLYPLDVDRAMAKLNTIHDDIAFYDTGAQSVQQLESGDVVMSIAWSGRALEAVRNGAPYAPVWNNALLLADSLSVVKGSDNVEEAINLINYATSPGAQEGFVEQYTYGVANSEAQPELDETAQNFLPSDPENAANGVWRDEQWWADNYDAMVERWTEWVAG
jgi:putative spermidine/putrescine transport system substrate-binding protein